MKTKRWDTNPTRDGTSHYIQEPDGSLLTFAEHAEKYRHGRLSMGGLVEFKDAYQVGRSVLMADGKPLMVRICVMKSFTREEALRILYGGEFGFVERKWR